jgi:hypothetical protein
VRGRVIVEIDTTIVLLSTFSWVLATDHRDEPKYHSKHQQDVNETAHGAPSEEAYGPKRQQYDHRDSEHEALGNKNNSFGIYIGGRDTIKLVA